MNALVAATPLTIGLLIAGLVAAALFSLAQRRRRRGSWYNGTRKSLKLPIVPPVRAYARKPLLSPWEASEFGRLKAQLPPHLHLCPQVRLGDMLQVTVRDPELAYALGAQVWSKSVDFVVINQRSGDVELIIELNDGSHRREDRRARDETVRTALDQAGIPLAVFEPGTPIDLRDWLPTR